MKKDTATIPAPAPIEDGFCAWIRTTPMSENCRVALQVLQTAGHRIEAKIEGDTIKFYIIKESA